MKLSKEFLQKKMRLKSFTPQLAVIYNPFLITITLVKNFQVFMGINICLLAMLKLIAIRLQDFTKIEYNEIRTQKEYPDFFPLV